jgi:tetratricopeptide (TPR) repeat protein
MDLSNIFEIEALAEIHDDLKNYTNDKTVIEIPEKEPHEDKYLGLAQLGRIYCKIGDYYKLKRSFKKARKHFMIAIELNNSDAMMNYAMLCEMYGKDKSLIEKYYSMALLVCPDDVICMYNFADYYKTIKDYDNMVKYFKMVVDFADDLEAMYNLGDYFKHIGDIEQMRKYFFLAIKNGIIYADIPHVTIDPFTFLKLLESAKEEECSKEERDDNIRSLANIYSDIMIYRNKVNLFTRLNNVVDCGICYEEKLNINLCCGHCVCIDCYPHLYTKTCPFCRCCPGFPSMPAGF